MYVHTMDSYIPINVPEWAGAESELERWQQHRFSSDSVQAHFWRVYKDGTPGYIYSILVLAYIVYDCILIFRADGCGGCGGCRW